MASVGSCEEEPGRAHRLCIGGSDNSTDERKKMQIPARPVVPILCRYLFPFLQAVRLVPQS